MSAAMNKENLVNQLPASPYTPTQKGLKVSTPQKNNATKFKPSSKGSRQALQDATPNGTKQQQKIRVLKRKLVNTTQALREAESTINDMRVEAAASEREVALLRAQLAQQKQASYEAGSDDEQQPAAQQSARYRDLGLGFHVASLTNETDSSAAQEPMLAAPTTAQPQHYKDLQLGFAVSSLSMDF